MLRGGGLKASYKLNALGQRVSRTVGGATTHYAYDEAGHLLYERDAVSGLPIREYVWLNDRLLAQYDGSGAVQYLLTDHLGTPQKLLDASRSIVWDRSWQPFGETQTLTGNAATAWRNPGQIGSDSATNYNYFRDYDSSLGRYLQADPIGLSGGLNPYGYVGGKHHLRFSDLLGRMHVMDSSKTGDHIRSIAEREGMSSSIIKKQLPLAFLAPDIVQAILEGKQPEHLTTQALMRHTIIPLDWNAQRELLGFAARK